MALKSIEVSGFKSFAGNTRINFYHPVTAIVGPNGSGKSNIADAIRFGLGEQSIKSMRGGKGEDLIFNGSHKMGRKNRARVALAFDNSGGIFSMPASEVELERLVHRDGLNDYLVNSKKTRLKDKLELIASANIGTTGHHMVTQGEADKFVTVTNEERRALIEDALGLNVYKLRRREAYNKTKSAREKLLEVDVLIQKLEPIVQALSSEVDHLRRAKNKQRSLIKMYAELFQSWQQDIANRQQQSSEASVELESELSSLNKRIKDLEDKAMEKSALSDEEVKLSQKRQSNRSRILQLEEQIASAREERGECVGKLNYLQDQLKKLDKSETGVNVSINVEKTAIEDLTESVDRCDELSSAKKVVRDFSQKYIAAENEDLMTNEKEQLGSQIKQLELELTELKLKISGWQNDLDRLRQNDTEFDNALRELSRERLLAAKELEKQRFQLQQTKEAINKNQEGVEELKSERQRLQDKFSKAASQYGRSAIEKVEVKLGRENPANRLRHLRHQILRAEAQLEEADLGALDALEQELEIEAARLSHLISEKHDVETTMVRTQALVENLTLQIEERLEQGLQAVNENLERFFQVLFGGGECQLSSVNDGNKSGVAIELQLPFKRIRSVHALSGGERSLASLSILFAVTLLSPPPFVVLDETDAALDESNSRRYAKLIRELADHTQLILITHNRETMTHADELYGVTMGSDGVSRLLSVSLAEAIPMGKI